MERTNEELEPRGLYLTHIGLQDILWLVAHEQLAAADIWSAVDRADYPPILAEAFAEARQRLARVLPRP